MNAASGYRPRLRAARLSRGLAVLALLALSALALSALVPRPAAAANSTDACAATIESVPVVISTQGVWCLGSDLSTAITYGRAIDIRTNNVTVDCNGHALNAGNDPATLAIGIAATGRSNITVRNCSVRHFLRGLQFSGSGGGHSVHDNLFFSIRETAVAVQGDGVRIWRNRIHRTGQSEIYPDAFGIRTSGSAHVRENLIEQVSGMFAAGTGYGILMEANPDGSATDNLVMHIFGGLASYGLRHAGGGRATLRGNIVIANGDMIGMSCDSGDTRALANIVSGGVIWIRGCSRGLGDNRNIEMN